MKARRENSARRKRPYRRPKPRLLVVCGALCTEYQYLSQLRDHLNETAVDFTLARRAKAPDQLVDYAKDRARHLKRDFDELWCVVDTDDFDIGLAKRRAERESVELAVSNPCFELWLLLHHEDRAAPLRDYQETVYRLKRHVLAYDKSNLDLAEFIGGVREACDRARRLEKPGEPNPNPSTGVWRLVEKIMENPR